MKKLLIFILILACLFIGCQRGENMATVQKTTTGDDYVNSGSPDSIHGGGSGNYLIIGYDTTGPQIKRTFLDFDFSSIPATAKISSASLYMHQWDGVSTAEGITFDAYRVTGSWDEDTVTWNNQPATEGTPTVTGLTCAFTSSDIWRNWDITALVKELILEGDTAIMLRLQAESGNYHQQLFYATESGGGSAYISITYTVPVSVNVGDAWKESSSVKVNIADTWRTVSSVKVNVGDAWKEVF
jgi:hypothetical protein